MSGPGDDPGMPGLGGALAHLLDLALPATCPGCGREGPPVCEACRPALHARRGPGGGTLGLADPPPAPLLQVEWCAPFAGTVRRALHQLKYGGETRLAGPLGDALAARWRAAGAGGDLLVPVPVHAARRRERGYDQAELLAAAAAARLGLPAAPALARWRVTDPQYRLDRSARAANVGGAFAAVPGHPLAGRWVLLVDDVVTTGATLAAAGEAVLEAGAAAVSALAVARER